MPCLMELERVVIVRTLLNCKRQRFVMLRGTEPHGCWGRQDPHPGVPVLLLCPLP